MKKVLIRADSSSSIGHGHIMRCLVLAKQYLNKGYDVSFATLNLKGNLNKKILKNSYDVHILKSNNNEELIKKIKELEIDLLIIDSYDIKYKSQKSIKLKTDVKILCLDDTYEKHYCDILLNHNIGANKKKYKSLVPSFCEIRCGVKYTLLRDEFYKYKNMNLKQNNKTKVFLAIGGTDHSNINIKILKVLSKFKNIEVNLVTTSANSNLDILKQYCKEKDFIKLYIDTNNIAKLMKESSFAIVSASVILNEVYFMQLPFIAIKTASNQKNIYKYLKKKKYLVMKKFNKKRLKKLIKKM
ncbi:UDP-2,4-diacetamido-2,4,6-trideoxy-beta-L-altropyranose hydrolase [Malaciobacter marinus]|uniref:UDP-2,4-diacetamido-2,4, 6-trideoxy-beta-L-altropyranose hydrolase n=1 Tax=Malaciobacter marinus TaxID=505249 RepID=UPI003B005EA2